MKPFLILATAFAGVYIAAHAIAAQPDAKATTLVLDKIGNAVSVSREGAYIHLMTREARLNNSDPDREVVLVSDGGVRLTRRQALRLTELLDDAMREIAKDNDTANSDKKKFRLASTGRTGRDD